MCGGAGGVTRGAGGVASGAGGVTSGSADPRWLKGFAVSLVREIVDLAVSLISSLTPWTLTLS